MTVEIVRLCRLIGCWKENATKLILILFPIPWTIQAAFETKRRIKRSIEWQLPLFRLHDLVDCLDIGPESVVSVRFQVCVRWPESIE